MCVWRKPRRLTYQDGHDETCIVTEESEGGRAILCFLSQVDALIEFLQGYAIGEQYQIIPAQEVQPSAFRDADGRVLIAKIHVGWPAIDGRLLLRPDGSFARYSQVIHHRLQGPPTFEVDPGTLAEITRLHEAAGIFAWRETLDRARECDPGHLGHVAAHAMSTVEFAHGNPSQSQQIALFDLEAGHWRFLPIVRGK